MPLLALPLLLMAFAQASPPLFGAPPPRPAHEATLDCCQLEHVFLECDRVVLGRVEHLQDIQHAKPRHEVCRHKVKPGLLSGTEDEATVRVLELRVEETLWESWGSRRSL